MLEKSTQMDRLEPPPACQPSLYLYNHLTLSISIVSPLWLFYPLKQLVSFASLLSLYPPLWQLFPSLLCHALFLLFFLGINTTPFFSFHSSPGIADIGNMAPVFLSLLWFFFCSLSLHCSFLLSFARAGN